MNFLLVVVLLAYPYSVVYSDISNDINNDINNEINDINNEINYINNDINNVANLIEDPDIHRNVTELITSKGYPVENHFAYTEDGYELSLQRIPYGKLNKKTGNRKPVLLQHGILESSADWVINYPHQSLGFLLADYGYDVWLGNTRGGAYSRQHLNFETNSKDFWDFSFDQMAEYDLPAMIDYILNVTKEDNLVYIGHSQGTTIAFALLSEKPLYNEKIKLFVALAPEVEVSHVKSIVSNLVPYFEYIESIMNTFGVYEFMSNNPAQQFITRNLCASKSAFICENIMYMVFGKDSEQYNQTRTPVYAAHFPNGASIKNVVHFSQMVKSKKFRKFDYGKENWKYYNQDTPPEYNLSNVVTPTALFWGMNDALADTEDISLLEKRLKSLVYSYCVPWKNFSHFDFVLAKDAKKLVYDEIMSLIKQFQNNKAPFINKSFERKACQ